MSFYSLRYFFLSLLLSGALPDSTNKRYGGVPVRVLAGWVALSITVTYSWGKEKKKTQQIHPHASCFSKFLLPWRIWLLFFFSYFSEFSCSLFWILSKIYSWNQEEEWTIGGLHHYSRSKTLMSYLFNLCHVSVLTRDFIYFWVFFLMRLQGICYFIKCLIFFNWYFVFYFFNFWSIFMIFSLLSSFIAFLKFKNVRKWEV